MHIYLKCDLGSSLPFRGKNHRFEEKHLKDLEWHSTEGSKSGQSVIEGRSSFQMNFL